jgi:hypothetical protein
MVTEISPGVRLTSPRLRGEAQAAFGGRSEKNAEGEASAMLRSNPGEGAQVHQFTLASRIEPLTPTLSPQERGEGVQAERVAL